MNLNTIFTLGEYKNLFVAETFCEKDGNIGIPKKDFDALETNILTHEKNVAQFFRPTYKKISENVLKHAILLAFYDFGME